MDRLLLKPREAAQLLGLGRNTVYQLLQQGVLPSVRFGHSVRVPVRALEEWIAQHQQGGRHVETGEADGVQRSIEPQ